MQKKNPVTSLEECGVVIRGPVAVSTRATSDVEGEGNKKKKTTADLVTEL